jgi:hypothetical protein
MDEDSDGLRRGLKSVAKFWGYVFLIALLYALVHRANLVPWS